MLTKTRIAVAFLAAHLLAAQPPQAWVGSWATAVQVPEPQNAVAPADLRDATLRQIVHLSAGGNTLRVRISNAFGGAPLHFASVHVARPLSPSQPRIDPASDKAVTFSGRPDVLVPPASEYVSDALEYSVPALSDLAITIYFDQPPDVQTGHPGSRATSWLIHGNAVSAADLPGAKSVEHWYQIAGIDVVASGGASIVALGDSITDGHGATTNGNDRWPDVLARRLQAASAYRPLGVLNQGIGGNHLLTDGLGPNVLARFDRDVLAQPGVRYVIVLEGVNDLGRLARDGISDPAEHAELVHRIEAAYEQIVTRAHAQGVQVFGATILPYVGSNYYHPGPADEADRIAVNKWIRAAGHFDAVVDLDRTMRDPEKPDRLLTAYDSGDHLHPSPAGYAAMANAIPLALFDRTSSASLAALAPTPPMGWNSWDSFGTGVTEAEVKANADYMAAKLAPYGWQYIVVDIQWSEPNPKTHGYRPGAELTMDGYGRLMPAPNRFPSSANGKGFKPLADYVHSKGLKFGIHIMRGIPRRAAEANLPVFGSTATAAAIANRESICPWNTDMYGVDTSVPAGQDYYDSIAELYASWGVDFIKADDMLGPGTNRNAEIAALSEALRKTGRQIVLSLSPGTRYIENAAFLGEHAEMWRISNDLWDRWIDVKRQFANFAKWNPFATPGNWPDGDMLPLGRIGIRAERGEPRMSLLTHDEQRTLMTLWAMARSPLMFGGNLPDNDDFTLRLLTNRELLDIDQHAVRSRQLLNDGDRAAWEAEMPDHRKYTALLNIGDAETTMHFGARDYTLAPHACLLIREAE